MAEPDEYLLRGDDAELAVARARLARRQTELMAALVAGGPVPEGFDPAQVATQARGLLAKRRDTTARVVPEPARILGADWRPLFDRYARQGPQRGGYRADAREFAAWALAAEPAAAWHAELEHWLRPAAAAHAPGPLRAARAVLSGTVLARTVHDRLRRRGGADTHGRPAPSRG
ncbi:hypothetical protein KSNIM_12300 [Kitasatospora sp. DSM 101779]|nr:hypothetical protein [Kitasatospora sp. DSM 101779]MCU7822438.1 hypothetical protein [Kitasatospora sp. DSM 101779]